MANKHGDFIWYELMTTDADAAREFYEPVVGWTIEAQPPGPIDYRMVTASGGTVAGILPLTPEMTAGGARPAWVGYIAVDDVDKTVTSVEQGGGAVRMPATTLPGVGRIALVCDPQMAAFYIMKPTPPADRPDATSTAFAAERPMIGHCAWNELATADPGDALRFYGTRFGWVKDGTMDMGPMGTCHVVRHGAMIGAMMPKPPQMPVSAWTYYFRVPDIDAAAATIATHGGQVRHGPVEVPGGDWSLNAIDPQGAMFALVGKRKG